MQEKTEVTSNTPAQTAEFIPVTQWPHNWPTSGAWRALIFNADTRKTSKGKIKGNGLIEAGVIRASVAVCWSIPHVSSHGWNNRG